MRAILCRIGLHKWSYYRLAMTSTLMPPDYDIDGLARECLRCVRVEYRLADGSWQYYAQGGFMRNPFKHDEGNVT